MPNQKLFEAMGVMYRAGKIHSFADILLYVTRGAIAKAIGLGGSRFTRKAADPSTFTDHEVEKMARLFDIPVTDMRELCQSPRKGK